MDAIEQLRKDLTTVNAKGKLDVLAAAAGISKKHLKEIMEGKAEPTTLEISTINMLK